MSRRAWGQFVPYTRMHAALKGPPSPDAPQAPRARRALDASPGPLARALRHSSNAATRTK